jgi:hypothetical protein
MFAFSFVHDIGNVVTQATANVETTEEVRELVDRYLGKIDAATRDGTWIPGTSTLSVSVMIGHGAAYAVREKTLFSGRSM